MNEGITLDQLECTRTTLREHFANSDPKLLKLFDEPFMEKRFFDICDRLLEHRNKYRGIVVQVRPDMFDAFFKNIGPEDQVRLLTIGVPLPIEPHLEKITHASAAWIFEKQEEDKILELLGLSHLSQ